MERPILFSGKMVKAILEGRKSQTRRVMKPQPKGLTGAGSLWFDPPYKGLIYDNNEGQPSLLALSPYGRPGDRLWVRETFSGRRTIDGRLHYDLPVLYKADGVLADASCGWKPPIFMPRWASRITLEITKVRVERLADISEDDAVKEGVDFFQVSPDGNGCFKESFKILWDSINGKKYPWDSNPWVYVIEFAYSGSNADKDTSRSASLKSSR